MRQPADDAPYRCLFLRTEEQPITSVCLKSKVLGLFHFGISRRHSACCALRGIDRDLGRAYVVVKRML